MVKHIVLLAGTVVLTLTLTGCGGAAGSSSGGKSSGTSGTGGGSTTKSAIVKTVVVKESEFKLVPSSITLKKPGTYVFKAENVGSASHALEIEGNGVETETKVLDAGKSGGIQVKLKPGNYEMYCPVDNHKDNGMKGKITVAGDGDSGGGGGPGGGY
ncbi:MAG TPA: cupredoxin domain-containing protein [Rubrobacteraceae bacterium]|nr:cupredoxin domain-containing protein [Rubrobacteraceae bacterium]